MQFIILFLTLFSFENFAACKAYNSIFEALEDGSLSADFARDVRRDMIAHGGYYTRQAMRRKIANAQWTNHGCKHCPPGNRTPEQVRRMTETSGSSSRYHPEVNIHDLERRALSKSDCFFVPRTGSDFWKLCKFDEPIGFDGGRPTSWMRVEMAGNTFHGHPMSLRRIERYTGKLPEEH